MLGGGAQAIDSSAELQACQSSVAELDEVFCIGHKATSGPLVRVVHVSCVEEGTLVIAMVVPLMGTRWGNSL